MTFRSKVLDGTLQAHVSQTAVFRQFPVVEFGRNCQKASTHHDFSAGCVQKVHRFPELFEPDFQDFWIDFSDFL